MIEIRQSQISDADKIVLKNINSFNWLFFTSRNGVVNFFKHLIDVKGNTELSSDIKIAAIGNKTALELEYYGFSAEFISQGNTSEELLDEFSKGAKTKFIKDITCFRKSGE